MAELLLTPRNQNEAVPYSRPETPNSHAAQRIGFVGLGAMGYLMAQNLANYRASLPGGLPPLLVWNRSVDKSEKLLHALGKDKVRIAQELAQVASECDVIITNLANDAVVKSVYEKFTEALKVYNLYGLCEACI
jgi:3-hydroxyisobutyrate dehydrogenase-like beta-hydroxyacid dehydrogenase